MTAKIKLYLKISQSLLRVPTYLLLLMYLCTGFVAGLTVTSADNSLLSTLKLILSGLIIALWYINGTALNDYTDYEIDIINLKGDKERPLVVGSASRRQLIYIAAIAALLALFSAFILSPRHFIVVAALLVLNMSYSFKPLRISRRGLLAPLLLPMGYVLLPYSLGYLSQTSETNNLTYVLLISLYLQFIGRIILKDYRDVKGDKVHKKMTFLLRHGNLAVCLVSALAISTSALILITLSDIYLKIFSFCIVTLTVFSITLLYQLSNTSTWKQQKPLLAGFGRAMTGVTASIIAGLVTYNLELSAWKNTLIAVLITIVYIWSASEAYNYNIKVLAK
jgi:4-hydroxybenzoate polyprenyltransferase